MNLYLQSGADGGEDYELSKRDTYMTGTSGANGEERQTRWRWNRRKL